MLKFILSTVFLASGLAQAAEFEGVFHVQSQVCTYDNMPMDCGGIGADKIQIDWQKSNDIIQIHWIKGGSEIFRNDLFNMEVSDPSYSATQVLMITPHEDGFSCSFQSSDGPMTADYQFSPVGDNQFMFTYNTDQTSNVEFVLTKEKR